MREAVSGVPGVIGFSDSRALKDTVDSLLGFFYIIVGIMLVFGGAMAFALMFNSISVTLAERSGEIATLVAAGMAYRRVALLLAAENLLATTAGLAPGLIVAWLAGREFLASFDSDLFRFAWHPEPATLLISALAVVATAAAAQVPGLWAIRNLDVAAAMRERLT